MFKKSIVAAAICLPLVMSSGSAFAAAAEKPIEAGIALNGGEWPTSYTPTIRHGVTIVSLQDFAAVFGLSIVHSPSSKKVAAASEDKLVELEIGSAAAKINGKTVSLEAAVTQDAGGVIYLPLRNMAEQLGGKLKWDPSKQRADLHTKGTPLRNNLYAYIEQYADNKDFRGSVLIMQSGKTVFAGNYGLADDAKSLPNSEQTQYKAASLTKILTAVAIAKLEEEGKLSIEDSIAKYFPDIAAWKPIKIKYLLSHTSGLANYTDVLVQQKAIEKGGALTREDLLEVASRTVKLSEQIDLVSGLPLAFEPGTNEQYINTNYLLLGLILEKITGDSYAGFVQKQIFDPAGMKRSTLTAKDAPDLAKPHVEHAATAKELNEENMSYGALITTTSDLAKFMGALHGGTILKPETVGRMEKTLLFKHGYGWNIDEQHGSKTISHTGDDIGFQAQLTYYPEQDISVIVLSNNQLDFLSGLLSQQNAAEYFAKRQSVGNVFDLSNQIIAMIDAHVASGSLSP